jgi:hypothetical protein
MYSVDIFTDEQVHSEIPNVKLPFVPVEGQFIEYNIGGKTYEGKITDVSIITCDGDFIGFEIDIDDVAALK